MDLQPLESLLVQPLRLLHLAEFFLKSVFLLRLHGAHELLLLPQKPMVELLIKRGLVLQQKGAFIHIYAYDMYIHIL
jgi:hypothetical protein